MAVNAACDTKSLQQCLDSACAIGIDFDPSVRCKLCGSTSAVSAKSESKIYGDAPVFQSLSIGKKTSLNLDVTNAPSDPAARYKWAIDECVKRVSSCKAVDANSLYDDLISKSCTAAAEAKESEKKLSARKSTTTESQCISRVKSCMSEPTKCGSGLISCQRDSSKYSSSLSSCLISTDCSDHGTAVAANMKTSMNEFGVARASEIKSKSESASATRQQKIDVITAACSTRMDECVGFYCAAIQTDKTKNCKTNQQINLAKQMCAYVTIACQGIK